jgi:DNA-binding transcriptional ArsR family regulator
MSPKTELVEELVTLAWAQWTALGVNGLEPARGSALDLEALMLLTAELVEDDPRLFGEAVDWCSRHHRYVSKPRLKQLLSSSAPTTAESFGGFASALEAYAGGRWPNARDASPPRLHLSGRSRAPDPEQPSLLNLRLRSLFGVGARADVITALLGWPSPAFTASDLVFVGYTKRNLSDTLDSLRAAGLLSSKRAGNRVLFSWHRFRELSALVAPLPSSIPRWPTIVRVLSSFLALLASTEGKSERLSLVVAATALREIAPDLDVLGMTPPRVTLSDTSWNDVTAWLLQSSRRLTQGHRS